MLYLTYSHDEYARYSKHARDVVQYVKEVLCSYSTGVETATYRGGVGGSRSHSELKKTKGSPFGLYVR